MLGLQASATISSYHTLDSTRVWCTLRQEFQQPRTSLTLWWRLRILYTGSHCFQIWRIWLHPTGATSMFSSLTVFVNNSTIISRRVGQLLVFFIYYGMSRDSQTLKQIGIFFLLSLCSSGCPESHCSPVWLWQASLPNESSSQALSKYFYFAPILEKMHPLLPICM